MKFLLLLILLSPRPLLAQEIEEATGLQEEQSQEKNREIRNDNFRYRSYLLAEWTHTSIKQKVFEEFPNIEASFAADYKSGQITSFIDGIANYTDGSSHTQGFLNQLGARYQVSDHVILALGKERNRRSPGIVISPSDLLFSTTNLPGLREDRRGEWLARASYQIPHASYDFFVLPVDQQNAGGWPAEQSKYRGTLVRTLQQFKNIDVSFSLGRFDETTAAGVALQGIIANSFKLYYEVGYWSKVISKQASQHLLGVSYEGSNDWSFKLEYFVNGDEQTSLLFTRKHYLLFTTSLIEALNRYNVFVSLIRSLEDESWLTLLRGEYIIDDRMVTGLTGVYVFGKQYSSVPFDYQARWDVKYSF